MKKMHLQQTIVVGLLVIAILYEVSIFHDRYIAVIRRNDEEAYVLEVLCSSADPTKLGVRYALICDDINQNLRSSVYLNALRDTIRANVASFPNIEWYWSFPVMMLAAFWKMISGKRQTQHPYVMPHGGSEFVIFNDGVPQNFLNGVPSRDLRPRIKYA